MKDHYTNYPRTILWLVRGGTVTVGGDEPEASPRFEAEVEPFYISKYPITNRQYEAFDPHFQRAPHSLGDTDTAVGVSYADALAYCDWYGTVARKPFRLPREIEWEYACRAGASGRFFFENPADAGEYLWDSENSEGRIQDPESKKANGFGLHGMLGGVWEWTGSVFQPYPLPSDPAEETDHSAPRVLRGGSFRLHRDAISCAMRMAADPRERRDDAGFRLVKNLR